MIELDIGDDGGNEAADGPLLNPFGLFLRTSLLPDCGDGCFATADIPGGALLGNYVEGGGLIKKEDGLELEEDAREYLMDVVHRGRRVVANNTSSVLARMNHQWGEGANVWFDEEGNFWAKRKGVAVAEIAAPADDDDDGGCEDDEEDENNNSGGGGGEEEEEGDVELRKQRKARKKRRRIKAKFGGKMAELYVDYGHAYWIHRLLGKAAHGKYLQCKRMKSSRRSSAQRAFMKACEGQVKVLLPNVGEVQSAADRAVRESWWANRSAEQARDSRAERRQKRVKLREQAELEAALAAIAASEQAAAEAAAAAETAETAEGAAASAAIRGGQGDAVGGGVVVVKKEANPPPSLPAPFAAPFPP